ncbi:uncharacterized protein [Musca autumnalis]|uniref:uncharacterized protein n=1 Tax=Musca autumnalis TaxID=221902 RepID=UPI003CF590F7
MSSTVAVALLLVFMSLMLVCKIDEAQANGERLSIRLCCPNTELYNAAIHQCQSLSNDFTPSGWEVSNFWSDGNETKVNILRDLNSKVEMVPCGKPFFYRFFEYSNDLEHCYTPYYHKQLKKYIIATVDCSLIDQCYNFIYNSYIYAIGFSTLCSILAAILNGSNKDLRQKLCWKLLLCYLISWMVAHILAMMALRFRCTEMVLYVWIFYIASRMCLLFMGYKIGLQVAAKTLDIFGKNRFLLAFSYVCIGTIAVGLSSWYLKDRIPLDTLTSQIPIVIMLIAAAFVFVYFVYRFRPQTIFIAVKRKPFLKKRFPILLYIFYLIVLPWIMLLLWPVYYKNISITTAFYIYLIIEGPILLFIFVTNRQLFCDRKRSGALSTSIAINCSEL